ncbi:hypothetical protein TNCV_1442451 [Trichonephila clavipes]|uniref:Uncharacterized protein n=1 Tax=Trichonephila clavipes TaxID=2585209 RepID=A0A8X6UXI7_TRICX|nr:hypothetical protein TNCV_1442451 [Trichonephila clavipes]
MATNNHQDNFARGTIIDKLEEMRSLTNVEKKFEIDKSVDFLKSLKTFQMATTVVLFETCLFHVTRHDGGQQTAIRSPSQEENTLNVVADRTESSTRAVAHHLSVSL